MYEKSRSKKSSTKDEKEEPKAKPKAAEEDYGAGTFSLDALKKLTGSFIGGTGSAPEGIEQGVRGDLVECGVFAGAQVAAMARACQRLDGSLCSW